MWQHQLKTPSGKPRARRLDIPLQGRPGQWNAITDVPGLELGYATLIEGGNVRTGVTAIHPRGAHNMGNPCSAGVHSQNGNGEMTGVAWIEESGTMAGPVCITNTHAVGFCHAAVIAWTNNHYPSLSATWLLPVCTETYDGYLNDINGGHVTIETGLQALESAATGPIEEGSVGGGTGMNCYEFKGGSGTASRLVEHDDTSYTVGVFVQANFGARHELEIAGVPIGAALIEDNPMQQFYAAPSGAGSVVAIVATDAPLLPHQCKSLARRVTIGVGRTGTSGSHFSGDLFLAVSTANADGFTPSFKRQDPDFTRPYDHLRFIPWGAMDPFFEAVVQATEEAILNSLVANKEMIGFHGHRTPALPHAKVVELLCDRGVISDT